MNSMSKSRVDFGHTNWTSHIAVAGGVNDSISGDNTIEIFEAQKGGNGNGQWNVLTCTMSQPRKYACLIY